MRICRVPDANLRFLRGALDRLVNAVPPGSGRIDGPDPYTHLCTARRIIDDVAAGNPHADCHYRHRANRGMLEMAYDGLMVLRTLIFELVELRASGTADDDEDLLLGQWSAVNDFDLDTALGHLSPEVLDKWQVEDA